MAARVWGLRAGAGLGQGLQPTLLPRQRDPQEHKQIKWTFS